MECTARLETTCSWAGSRQGLALKPRVAVAVLSLIGRQANNPKLCSSPECHDLKGQQIGENVILLVNLAWSAALYIRFMRGRGSFASLERWQTNYLPVYALWAAIVVIAFPPAFGFI